MTERGTFAVICWLAQGDLFEAPGKHTVLSLTLCMIHGVKVVHKGLQLVYLETSLKLGLCVIVPKLWVLSFLERSLSIQVP